ncbi:MAG: cyanophycinase [Bacteroidales bacterium]
MRNKYFLLYLVSIILMTGCHRQDTLEEHNKAKGALFIIGGGKRPPEMIRRLIDDAAFSTGDYIIVLPMSSEEPDTSFWYTREQFVKGGIPEEKICNFMVRDVEGMTPQYLDSVRYARIIYIPGGDQSAFMSVVLNTPLHSAIREAWESGAMVAGTSAGAAVMSRMMITGNELKYPEYTGDFRTIEADNIELGEGLGLLDHVIIDQHFIYRMRMNRLITTVLEHPGTVGVGIDEATAILVRGDSAEVVGESQVIVLRNPGEQINLRQDLLGGQDLSMDVCLPGTRFYLGTQGKQRN